MSFCLGITSSFFKITLLFAFAKATKVHQQKEIGPESLITILAKYLEKA